MVTQHNSAVWPVPYACAQPYHPGSGSQGQLFRPCWDSSAWHSPRQRAEQSSVHLPFTAEASTKHSSKRQLHIVNAVAPYALPRLSCTVAATATTFTMWSCRLKECFAFASAVKRRCALNFVQLSAWGYAMLMSPSKDETAVHGCHCPGVWLCACVRYWPYRAVVLCDHCEYVYSF